MRRIKLLLSYEGTGFSGWQRQKEDRTVQGEVEKALAVLHKKPVGVVAAGRTDAGVHAYGQVCHFDTDSSVPGQRFKEALNSLLPPDVRVITSREVEKTFHARFSALKRTYHYYIGTAGLFLPFDRNLCYKSRNIPSLPALNACARQIVGVHDFTSFTAAGDMSPSKVRDIFSSSFHMERGYMIYKIEGTAFLWKMVRSLVGTMLETAMLPSPAVRMKEILDSRDRRKAGTTAPAKGLFFFKVEYEQRYT